MLKSNFTGETLLRGALFLNTPATILSITPQRGPASGLMTITVRSSGLLSPDPTRSWAIGEKPISFVSVDNDTTLLTVPAGTHPPGPYSVQVSSARTGLSSSSSSVSLVATSITSVSPSTFGTGGGITVTATGTGFFDDAVSVRVGAWRAIFEQRVSESSVIFRTGPVPQSAAGSYGVDISFADGSSASLPVGSITLIPTTLAPGSEVAIAISARSVAFATNWAAVATLRKATSEIPVLTVLGGSVKKTTTQRGVEIRTVAQRLMISDSALQEILSGNVSSTAAEVASRFDGQLDLTSQDVEVAAQAVLDVSLRVMGQEDRLSMHLVTGVPISIVCAAALPSGRSRGGVPSFSWSEPSFQNLSLAARAAPISDSSSAIVLDAAQLLFGVTYSASCSVEVTGLGSGYAELQFALNAPPTGGTCEVSPANGTALETEFTVSCRGWADAELPLTYQPRIYNSEKGVYVPIGSPRSSESFVTRLPATSAGPVSLAVFVIDSMNAAARFDLAPVYLSMPTSAAVSAALLDLSKKATTEEIVQVVAGVSGYLGQMKLTPVAALELALLLAGADGGEEALLQVALQGMLAAQPIADLASEAIVKALAEFLRDLMANFKECVNLQEIRRFIASSVDSFVGAQDIVSNVIEVNLGDNVTISGLTDRIALSLPIYISNTSSISNGDGMAVLVYFDTGANEWRLVPQDGPLTYTQVPTANGTLLYVQGFTSHLTMFGVAYFENLRQNLERLSAGSTHPQVGPQSNYAGWNSNAHQSSGGASGADGVGVGLGVGLGVGVTLVAVVAAFSVLRFRRLRSIANAISSRASGSSNSFKPNSKLKEGARPERPPRPVEVMILL
eukprot:tig00020557_g11114.t1